ncbi:MAG: VOC family protein [Paracoccaceae bacterium]|nr:VOC family protein [Paracoccaceae bacterium]
MTNPIVVWNEIPVTDLDASVKFYNALFGWDMKINTDGPNPMADFGGRTDVSGGHLYPGQPARDNGPTVHFAVEDTLEAAAERCRAAGGTVIGEPIPLPTGRFIYAKDIDGNSIGLFETAG